MDMRSVADDIDNGRAARHTGTRSAAERRAGLSLVEIMVVISILGLIFSLLLPAIQAAREKTRRTSCLNNLREQGSAMMQFEQTKGRFPSAGQGTDHTASPPQTAFEFHSLYARLLRYLEEAYLAEGANFDLAYNDAACAKNQELAKTVIPVYLCPSNVLRMEDPDGYGITDYMPLTYTDIDPNQGIKNASTRMNGGFQLGGTPPAKIIDGLSRTIAVIEDSGRAYETLFPGMTSEYTDPIFSGGTAKVWDGTKQVDYTQWCASRGLTSGGLPAGDSQPPSQRRVMNRWAEPACAGGVSGQANSSVANPLEAINGNAIPAGGPPDCRWGQTNCGPNEEPWSFHSKGANVLMFDGSCRFVRDTIDPCVLRKLITADEQAPFGDDDVPE